MPCADLRSPPGCRALVIALILLISGCAAVPGKRDPRDPWEGMNRATYRFNDGLDRAIVKPVAKGYKKVVPRPVRTGIANVLGNAGFTTTIVNDLLQAKFKAFGADIGRFVLNSTLGLAGLLDPATAAGIPKNSEDFGQTLGRWGVGPGAYVVLPLLGPSTVRDTVGLYPDWRTDLKSLPDELWVRLTLDGLDLLGRRVELLSMEEVLGNAFDPYLFIRNAYLQHREYEVRDGDVPDVPTEEEPIEEEPVDEQPADTATPEKDAAEPVTGTPEVP